MRQIVETLLQSMLPVPLDFDACLQHADCNRALGRDAVPAVLHSAPRAKLRMAAAAVSASAPQAGVHAAHAAPLHCTSLPSLQFWSGDHMARGSKRAVLQYCMHVSSFTRAGAYLHAAYLCLSCCMPRVHIGRYGRHGLVQAVRWGS